MDPEASTPASEPAVAAPAGTPPSAAPDQRFLDQKARAEKAESEVKELKAQLQTHQGDPAPSVLPRVAEEAKDYARLVSKGYSDDEITFIERNRKEGQTLSTTAEDPFVKHAIIGFRAEKAVERGTPEPSNRAATPPQADSGRKSGIELEAMTPEERTTYFSGQKAKAVDPQAWRGERRAKNQTR